MKGHDERVDAVLALMAARLHEPFDLALFATGVRLSSRHLTRLFDRDFGAPPTIIFKAIKMRVARELLETTRLSVKEVAYKSGFSDISHFVRDFTRINGLSPARFRARTREISL